MKLLLALVCLLPAALAYNCTGKPDGVFEVGCKSFTTCAAGKSTRTDCDQTQVYDSKTGRCADPKTVGPPCGEMKDCTNKQDGHYADTDQRCKTYYTCAGGTFFGHNYCPSNTVFNEVLQSCDWPADTDPPCGTKGIATSGP